MKVALVYPPACDPTAPYLSVPTLTAQLRRRGIDVLPIDANVEAFDSILTASRLQELRGTIEARLEELAKRDHLPHLDQLNYVAMVRALPAAFAVPELIEDAKATLRDARRFAEPDSYDRATAVIDHAMTVVSAAYSPLKLDFTTYRTPFSMLSIEEVESDAQRERNPFFDWVETVLGPRLRAAEVNLVGLSVCFPGQLQPAYSFALQLKRLLPGVHLTVGGPGVTQMMIRLQGHALAKALGPFDSAILYEGEGPLVALIEALERKSPLRNLENVVLRDKLMGARFTAGHGMQDLRELLAPDFDGLPLNKYFSPSLVLPYDPTRGCYWGKCTFCHYGLAEVGTAAYRERPVDTVVDHLEELRQKHGTSTFYFSQDSVAPKTLLKLADRLVERKVALQWATDLKPEKYLTQERAERLRLSGAVACALGVESGSQRVLDLIDKGAPVEVVGEVIDRLAHAGIAAEAMCFTDFPTETKSEALETLEFLDNRREKLGLFIVGEFGLTHGALVAQNPENFGLAELWQLKGDEFGLGLFFQPRVPAKSMEDREAVDDRLAEVSDGFLLRRYPWAGAVSTAHTILTYAARGPDAFRTLSSSRVGVDLPAIDLELPFDFSKAELAEEHEGVVWHEIVHNQRQVSRGLYHELVGDLPSLPKRPARYRVGEEVVRLRLPARRPDTSTNRAGRARRAGPT
jgi:anaerobic magnesium-protoporphyrin IX monomethyl ester cyclase